MHTLQTEAVDFAPAPQAVAARADVPYPEAQRVFYPALDGLRAIAFLMVLSAHYVFLPWGWGGVNVFFVLSGFLITGILLDTRDDPFRARNFYIRRTLRIFPLYFGILLLLLLLHPVLHWNWTLSWLAWPLYMANFLRFVSPEAIVGDSTLQHAANGWLNSAEPFENRLYFGHLWSLCVEEQFYLLWPWVVFNLRSRRALLWICGVAVVVIPLARVVAQHTAPAWMLSGDILYRATPFQLDSLLLGGMMALLWRGAQREWLLAIAKVVAIAGGILAVVYLAATLEGSPAHYQYPVWQFTWGLTFINVVSAAAILCCLPSGSWLSRCFSLAPLRWLGRISYGAYVFHDIPHILYGSLAASLAITYPALHPFHGTLTLLIALAATLAITWLSFRFFESPFLRLKQRFSR